MQTFRILCAIIVFVSGTKNMAFGDDSPWWSYEENKIHWCEVSKACCGHNQSPINLVTSESQRKTMLPLIFDQYHLIPKEMSINNNGHTVNIFISSDDVHPSVSGGGLKGVYMFDSLHFHWGRKDSEGSEHTIDGKHYSIELHMVHYSSNYKSLAAARSTYDDRKAVAVISVLYKADEKESLDVFTNITSELSFVKYKDETMQTNSTFALCNLLPVQMTSAFRYKGSLTTPGCNEDVVWTVFTDIQPIKHEQLEKFRDLMETEKNDIHQLPLVNNYRNVQNLRNRDVMLYNFKKSETTTQNSNS